MGPSRPNTDALGSNILVGHDGKLKLADFGLARFKTPAKHYTNNVVTRWYRSPELILGSESYSEAIDIWACGCILAEFMHRGPLFPGNDEREMASRVFQLLGTPTEQSWPGVSNLKLYDVYIPTMQYVARSSLRQHFHTFAEYIVLDLLEQLLTVDPSKRISAQEALRHPWFTTAPEPDRQSVKLPREPRNEAWLKKRFVEQQEKQQQRQKRQSMPTQSRKRSHPETFDQYDGTQPPRKQHRASTGSSATRYRSDDVQYRNTSSTKLR